MSEPLRKPRVEIFVDGTSFRIAQLNAASRMWTSEIGTQLARGYVLVKMRYYSSPLPRTQSDTYARQQRFFEGASENEGSRSRSWPHRTAARTSGAPIAGRFRRTGATSKTDVNLAIDRAVGAHTNRYDGAMLVAGDTHYVRAVEAVQATGRGVVWCHFPSQAHTDRLRQVCDEQVLLDDNFLRTCR